MTNLFAAALFTAAMVVPAMAEAPPPLPGTAKKLTGAEITTLYEGASVKWHNYAGDGTGTAKYNLQAGTQDVDYNMGGQKGSFTDKIRVNGDKFCYTVQANETCVLVYTDGNDIYEVTDEGVVASKNQKE